MNRAGKLFVSFSPAVSDKAAKAMREVVRRWKLHHRNDLALGISPNGPRPILVGWVNYYGRFHRSALRGCASHGRLVHRAMGTAEIQKTPRAHKASVGAGCVGLNPASQTCFAHWLMGSPVGAIGAG